MDISRIPGHRAYSRLVALTLALLVTTSSWGADTVRLEFEPNRVVRRERTTFQIRTMIPWQRGAEITRPELPEGLTWWAYPYPRPWVATAEDGAQIRMIEVLGALRVDAPGFYTVPSFQVKVGDEEVYTQPVELIGLEPDEREFLYPVTTRWRALPQQIWEGQAVSLVLEARNLTSLALPDTSGLRGSPSGLLEEAPGLGGIITRPHGQDILYDVPMASWIWTPGSTGLLNFPGSWVTVSGLTRATPAFSAEVLPLPQSVQNSGAVGQFRLSYEVDPGPYRVGDTVSVRLRVEGEGNLNVLRLPQPQWDGAVQVGDGASLSYVPGPQGYEGWREQRYDFRLERQGNASVRIPSWTWLDPSQDGRTFTESSFLRTLQVDAAGGVEKRKGLPQTLGAEAYSYQASVFHWRSPQWFLLALPGAVFMFVLFLVKRPGPRGLGVLLILPLFLSASQVNQTDTQGAINAAMLIQEGQFLQALESYDQLIDVHGNLPGLLHDRGIAALGAGKGDEAVHDLRTALLMRPGSPRLAQTLEEIENALSLTDQELTPLRWPPIIAFLFWLISVNAVFGVAARLLYVREARVAIALAAIIMVFLGSSGFMLGAEWLWSRPIAVVRTGAESLRKIPEPLATDWIRLPAGTSLRVLAEEGDNRLVRTGYGLEGWLPSSSLLAVENSVDGL